MTHVARTARGLLDLLFPPVCRLCNALRPADTDPDDPFCALCAPHLRPGGENTCPRCAATIGPYAWVEKGCPECAGRSLHFDAAYRLGKYAGPLRDAILRMKSLSGQDLAEALGRHWAESHAGALRAEPIHYVVPVPLHWVRRWQRGYNQAHAIAYGMARELKLPCRAHWLRRLRHTPAQHLLSPTARRDNVKNAFKARSRSELEGKTVLLVDDVLTTGTTCSEAAKALRAAGAGRVVAAVLARAEA